MELSPKSIKNIRATLRKVLVSAKAWGYLDAVPELPTVKVPEPGWDFFNGSESEKLLAAARTEEERTLLLFALRTGARAGEQIALEWGDIDWVNRRVVLRRSSTRGEVGPTKQGRDRRVPLCDSLHNALRRHRHIRGDLVFCNPDGSPYSLWQLHERLWATCRRAGLRRVRWHDLRHSFASQAVMEGVPMKVVQEWLGHSTITMVMRYAHLAPGADNDFFRRLDGQSYGNMTATGAP
jgi:integrase